MYEDTLASTVVVGSTLGGVVRVELKRAPPDVAEIAVERAPPILEASKLANKA